MTKRKNSILHRLWHKRVDGQIKNTINAHPGWFNIKSELDYEAIVNSLSKRIVGEIVAGLGAGAMSDFCTSPTSQLDMISHVSSNGSGVVQAAPDLVKHTIKSIFGTLPAITTEVEIKEMVILFVDKQNRAGVVCRNDDYAMMLIKAMAAMDYEVESIAKPH